MTVVLCASFPAGGPRGDAVAPFHVREIAAAAAAVTEAVLRSGVDLVFGAHPTISPIVLRTADVLDAGRQVRIFQSRLFARATTPEVHRLVSALGATLVETPAPDDDRAAGLTWMRRAMFEAGPRAAFFCGGMEGLVEEFTLAGGVGSHRFLFTTPGGMAARLAREHVAGAVPEGDEVVGREPAALVGRAYGSLALEALERVGIREPRATGPFETEIDRLSDDPAT